MSPVNQYGSVKAKTLLSSQFFNEPPSLREAYANAQRLQELAQRTQREEREGKNCLTELYCPINILKQWKLITVRPYGMF
ncbi:MAG: hypothetical protein RMZ41_008810 [Nostoc sp. DedVER02]